MEDLLRNKNLKVTPGRLEILSVLSQTKSPQSAEDIYGQLGQSVDLVTIYRNLEKFEQSGLIFRETVGSKDCYYLAKSPHHHIVCRICHKSECLPCDHGRIKISNFSDIDHQLQLSGICKRCKNKC